MRGIHLSPVEFPSPMISNVIIGVFCTVSFNKLLNKQLSIQLFDTIWWSRDINVVNSWSSWHKKCSKNGRMDHFPLFIQVNRIVLFCKIISIIWSLFSNIYVKPYFTKQYINGLKLNCWIWSGLFANASLHTIGGRFHSEKWSDMSIWDWVFWFQG